MNNFEFYLERAIAEREVIEENLVLTTQEMKQKGLVFIQKLNTLLVHAISGKAGKITKEGAIYLQIIQRWFNIPYVQLQGYLSNVETKKETEAGKGVESPIVTKLDKLLKSIIDGHNPDHVPNDVYDAAVQILKSGTEMLAKSNASVNV